MKKQDIDKILKAGKIAKEVREWIMPQVKHGMLLIEIAEKIESKIIELGAKPAFPTNLSINEIAAHFTPAFNDETRAHGLLKVDFGVHIDGWAADNSSTIDLENSPENKELIKAAQDALKNAIEVVKKNKSSTTVSQIGKAIQDTIEMHKGFTPITNLTGHSIEEYDLHSGISIPNVDTGSSTEIEEGLFAIEPFTTKGNGKVKDGKPSGIYQIINEKNTRSPTGREILMYVSEEHGTLPFCSRWLVKKFGNKALLALKQLEQDGILHQYPQLVETSGNKVAQAEHSILVHNNEVIVTTD